MRALTHLLFLALTLVSAVSHAEGEKKGDSANLYLAPEVQASTEDAEVNELRNQFDRLYEQPWIARKEIGGHSISLAADRFIKLQPLFFYTFAGALFLDASFSPFTRGYFATYSAAFGAGFYLFGVSMNSLANSSHSDLTTKLYKAREGNSTRPSGTPIAQLEQRLTRNERLDCRSTFLRLANPFRSSRIESRWIPMGVGAALFLPHQIGDLNFGPSLVFQRAKDALKDPKSIFKKLF